MSDSEQCPATTVHDHGIKSRGIRPGGPVDRPTTSEVRCRLDVGHEGDHVGGLDGSIRWSD